MQVRAKRFLLPAILLISVGLWSQEAYHAADPDLFARLSYESTSAAGRHVCMSVSRSEDYRLLNLLSNGAMIGFQGRMSDEQFKQLQGWLAAPDFRPVPGKEGGLIRRESESLTAEIPNSEKGAQRIQWLNADGQSPFLGSVAKVVDWLKGFPPKNARLLQEAEFGDVCPSGGVRFVQPPVAINRHR
jgi:hypothetical protein